MVGVRAPAGLRGMVGYDVRAEERVLAAVLAFQAAVSNPPVALTADGETAALPTLRRIAVASEDTYELAFAGDPRRCRITLAADGSVLAAIPDLSQVGDPATLVRVASTVHRARTKGDIEPSEPPALPIARTVAEAGAYLELALATTGGVDWRREVRVIHTGTETRVRFDGDYHRRPQQLEVIVPSPSDHPSALETHLRYGNGRSVLLDAGQWLTLALRYDFAARRRFQSLGDAQPDDWQYDEILRYLRLGAAAMHELAKFVQDGADTVGDDGFWTADGRDARASRPEEFRRHRIDLAREEHRQRVADFVAHYGPQHG